jgi:hypothetical protein
VPDILADACTGKNGRHPLVGLLRQSVFGRLAGYEDVNDADRLCRDPARRWVVGDRAVTGPPASASQMGRFETKWLSRPKNLAALVELPGQWIDKVHLALPKKTKPWPLTSLREKLIKIGAKVFSPGRYVTFQLAEVAVSRQMFSDMLSLIARLRAPPAPT